MLKMSTIHANTCIQMTTPPRNRCRDYGVVQQQTFFQFLHIIPSLEGYPRCSPPGSNLANWVATSLEG